MDYWPRFAFIAAVFFAFGVLTTVRWRDRAEQPPPPGWVCREVTWTTSAGSRQDRQCGPADGWHLEKWPDGATVAVPDSAQVVRRHVVRD